jgi:hypothetical protein
MWSGSIDNDGIEGLEFSAAVETVHAFQVEVNQDALALDEFVPWRVNLKEAYRVAGGRNDGVKKVYQEPRVLVRTSVFEGRVEFDARLSLFGRTPVFPRLEARRAVDVNAQSSKDGPIPVVLTFPAIGRLIRLSGRIQANRFGYRRPPSIVANRRDGRPCHHSPRLDSDGRFELMVAIDQLSGPQLAFDSTSHLTQHGPFALSHEDLDLGELSLQESAANPNAFEFSLSSR